MDFWKDFQTKWIHTLETIRWRCWGGLRPPKPPCTWGAAPFELMGSTHGRDTPESHQRAPKTLDPAETRLPPEIPPRAQRPPREPHSLPRPPRDLGRDPKDRPEPGPRDPQRRGDVDSIFILRSIFIFIVSIFSFTVSIFIFAFPFLFVAFPFLLGG